MDSSIVNIFPRALLNAHLTLSSTPPLLSLSSLPPVLQFTHGNFPVPIWITGYSLQISKKSIWNTNKTLTGACRRHLFVLACCLFNFPRTKDFFYYTDISVLLENTPLVKFIRNHIQDSSGMFPLSSLEKCSATFMWPLNKFWRIFGNLREVVGILWKIVKNAIISMSM